MKNIFVASWWLMKTAEIGCSRIEFKAKDAMNGKKKETSENENEMMKKKKYENMWDE